mmetsp:Transcript_475/g.1549  ORF Transcript_475/g.1549 Transcript_475/m.1549 type:complete len:224 (-) Transcript_475:290-961(-)
MPRAARAGRFRHTRRRAANWFTVSPMAPNSAGASWNGTSTRSQLRTPAPPTPPPKPGRLHRLLRVRAIPVARSGRRKKRTKRSETAGNTRNIGRTTPPRTAMVPPRPRPKTRTRRRGSRRAGRRTGGSRTRSMSDPEVVPRKRNTRKRTSTKTGVVPARIRVPRRSMRGLPRKPLPATQTASGSEARRRLPRRTTRRPRSRWSSRWVPCRRRGPPAAGWGARS